jgi:carbon monoxide dehydrogenase subunit G
MKYTTEIVVSKPIGEVVALFDNPDNLKYWMEGLQSFEPISGTPGQAGAKSRLTFLIGKRKLEMTETITSKNLPHEFSGVYEANGGYNTVVNRFEDIDGKQTKYTAEHEFKMSGVMKLLGWLMPGMFKKQSMKYLVAFKNFAEKQ